MTAPEIIAFLRDARADRGWTLRTLAARLGWQFNLLNRRELGKHDVHLTTLVDWAAGLGYRLTFEHAPVQSSASVQEVFDRDGVDALKNAA